MPQQPEVTFIICTYNRAGYLQLTLNSLLTNDAADEPFYEILVIDNNSTDQTAEVVKNYQQSDDKGRNFIRYIKEVKQGLTHARNRGIEESRAPNVVFLDDDIQAPPTFIRAWLSFFNQYPAAKAAGGKIHVRFDERRPDWISYYLLPLFGYHDLGKRMKKYPADKYPFGGNMGFKKAVFQVIGSFDENIGRKGDLFFVKGEEKELFQRIRTLSDEIYYVPEALAYHHVDGSRLSVDYIKKQALGIGRGMKLRIEKASPAYKMDSRLSEYGKWAASVVLAGFYMLKWQPSKAAMLFKFRRWIWKGYHERDPIAK